MFAHQALGIAVALLLGTAGVSDASNHLKPKPKGKPKPSCNLVKDMAGDVAYSRADTLDVTGGDLATSARKVTAVIRLAKLPGNGSNVETTSPLGADYYFLFSVPTSMTPFYLAYRTSPTGMPLATFGTEQPGFYQDGGPATAWVDAAKKELHLTATTADFGEYGSLRPGTPVSGFQIHAYRVAGATFPSAPPPPVERSYAVYGPGDDATSSARYTAGAPSCVRV